jgi:hypothetical protein
MADSNDALLKVAMFKYESAAKTANSEDTPAVPTREAGEREGEA